MNWQPFDKENLIDQSVRRMTNDFLFRIIKNGPSYTRGVQWVDFAFGSREVGEIICQPRGEDIWYIVRDNGEFTLGRVTHYTFIDPVEDDEK